MVEGETHRLLRGVRRGLEGTPASLRRPNGPPIQASCRRVRAGLLLTSLLLKNPFKTVFNLLHELQVEDVDHRLLAAFVCTLIGPTLTDRVEGVWVSAPVWFLARQQSNADSQNGGHGSNVLHLFAKVLLLVGSAAVDLLLPRPVRSAIAGRRAYGAGELERLRTGRAPGGV